MTGIFRIGNVSIQRQKRQVLLADQDFELEPKALDLLLYLIDRQDRVVSKEELLEKIWPGRVVTESSLYRLIRLIRQLFVDSDSEVVKTVHGHGYRFVGELEDCDQAGRGLVDQSPTQNQVERQPPASDLQTSHRGEIAPPQRSMTSKWVALTALAIGLVLIATIWHSRQSAKLAVVSAPIQSVAVLPFENFTGSPQRNYLGDGLAEEIIHILAQQPSLAVAARTSSFALRDTDLTAPQIADQLDVDGIFEGSIQRDGERQWATLQLIDARSGFHLGSAQFEIAEGDLFAAQQRIALNAIEMLESSGVALQDTVLSTRSVDPLAYATFLQARTALYQRTPESLALAKSYLDEALRLQPDYADALASLAQLNVVAPIQLGIDRTRAQQAAEAAVEAALRADPDNVGAITVGGALAFQRGELATSLALFERAITLQPGNAHAHQWYGETLGMLGYLERAGEELEIALKLDPLAGSTNSAYAKTVSMFDDERRHETAARRADRFGASMAPRMLSLHFFRTQQKALFVEELAAYYDVVGAPQTVVDSIEAQLNGQLDRDALLAILADQPSAMAANVDFYARELALLGEPEFALAALSRVPSRELRFASDIWLPEFKSVRALPGFTNFLADNGLLAFWHEHGSPDRCLGDSVETYCAAIGTATRSPKGTAR